MLGLSQKERNEVFIKAMAAESFEGMEAALKKGADVNALIAPPKQHPLLWATELYSESMALRVVNLFLEHGATVNVQSEGKKSPLSNAINRKHLEVFKRLVKAGMSPEAKMPNGKTPFLEAVHSNNVQLVTYLIDNGTAQKGYPREDGCLLTDLLSSEMPDSLIMKVVAAEADVNKVYAGRRHALTSVCSKGRDALFDLLMARPDIDVNVCTSPGRSALMAAIGNKHERCARRLIEKGADVQLQDERGNHPLLVAARTGSIPLVHAILKAATERGQKLPLDAPLLVAAENGHGRICSILAEAGANPETRDAEGQTPFIKAAINGHLDSLTALAKAKADVNAIDKGNMGAYDHALHKGHTNVKEYLITLRPDYVPPPPPPPPIDPNRFVKISDTTIEVRERGGLTLSFNFFTQQLIYREPEKPAMSVQNFVDVQRQEAIKEAFDKLVQLGGRPADPFAVSDSKKPGLPKPG